MKNKKLLMIATVLMIIGAIIFTGVMTMLDWNFKKLSTSMCNTNRYELTEAFTDISINTDTADIELVPSKDGTCVVTCVEEENAFHTVAVKDGTLEIQLVDNKRWYEYIGFNFNTLKITVSLPQEVYGQLTVKASTGDCKLDSSFRFSDVNIELSTGNIDLENISADSVALKVSTGKIHLQNITCTGDIQAEVSTGGVHLENISCKNLSSTGSTGKFDLENSAVAGNLYAKRSTGDVELENCTAGSLIAKTRTGDVELERCDAGEITIETTTGDVEGTLDTEKIFIINTGTGDVDVPESTSGGKCKITTSTGDITINFY